MKRIALPLFLTLTACGMGHEPFTPPIVPKSDLAKDSTPATPIDVIFGHEFQGKIAGQPQDKDFYIFEAKAGQDLDISVKVDQSVTNNTLDPFFYLQVYTGTHWSEVAKVDGDEFNSNEFSKIDAFYNLIVPQDAKYRIIVTSFNIANQHNLNENVTDNKETNRYILTVEER